MKTAVLAVLGLAALTQAQGTLPPCAQSCALNAIGATGCAVTDAACICTKPSFLTSSQTCIEGACSAADIQAALAYAQNFCLSAGVTLSVSSAAATVTSAAASSASEAASSAPAPTSTTEAATSAAAPPVSQISDGQPQAPTATPATFTGAAAPMQKNLMGGLAGLALGVAAAL